MRTKRGPDGFGDVPGPQGTYFFRVQGLVSTISIYER